ncbi:MAG: DUF58 domain-containing protein [Anaerolineae bacterium]|nr:DUF58 domain-containing protein [Anaerolineae bacterium]
MGRRLLLVVLVYALFLWGLVSLNGALLALAVPLIVWLGAALLWGTPKPRLRVSRSLSASRAPKGTPVSVKLSIANEGPLLEEILIEDMLPPGIELVAGEPRALASLGPDEKVDLEYAAAGKQRGIFIFRGVEVTTGDHLGIFRRRTTLPAPAQLAVAPESLKLRRLAIRPLRTRATAGPIPARQGGSGVDFFGVREYQPGDPLRWVNWRVSARYRQTLFTNEFEQERIADVGLILDARRRTDIRLNEHALFERAVSASASLAETFLSDGNRVGLLVYGGFLDWTFPGYGRVQRERILQALAKARTGDSLVFDSLDYIPTRFFPAKSQIVLISPLCPDDPPMLTRLRARGYQLMVVSPDPISFEARLLKPDKAVDLAVRIARLERLLLLRQLRRAGIQVVDWQVDRPFDQAIHTSLSRTAHWFRTIGVAP